MDGLSFDCGKCGKRHTGLPALAYVKPAAYFAVPEDRRGSVWINEDFCIIEDEIFLVRVVLLVPIVGETVPLEWGVWGSLSKTNFERYMESFEDHDQSRLGGMFSYLDSVMNGYPDTGGLRCNLHPQDNRKRPLLELQHDQDHPLVDDQINGITLERAIELAMPVLHPQAQS